MSDFERNVWCLLGIPVDVVTFSEAVGVLDSSIGRNERCFLSTPNLNFIVGAHQNETFRDSVLCSDLVLLDGMPPVWVARWLGIDGIEKISGSNLIEYLWQREPTESGRTRVFLFGGEEGVAETACERINDKSTGLECVGWNSPGFGSVTEISDAKFLNQINASSPDFVIVALGARKGQEWIMANMGELETPLISHLGAVVNFSAGRVSRAPSWMQEIGMEWFWRICQEPGLWHRYFFDGLYFCWHFAPGLLRYRTWRWLKRNKLQLQTVAQASVLYEENRVIISISGPCLDQTVEPLRKVFRQSLDKSPFIVLDLNGVDIVDGAFLGLCLILRRQAKLAGGGLAIERVAPSIRCVFKWNAVEWLL